MHTRGVELTIGDRKSGRWGSRVVGLVSAWLLVASSARGEDIAFPGVPASWELVQMADLEGDDRDELIFREPQAGPLSMYHVVPANEGGFEPSSFPLISTIWELVGSGDFNADGMEDLLWIHSNQVGVFLMNGLTPSWRPITLAGGPALIVASEELAAIGDLDGDGADELVWRHTQTGAANYWDLRSEEMSLEVVGVESLGSVSIDHWSIIGAEDADNDGDDDLYWRSLLDGRAYVWTFHQGGVQAGGGKLVDGPSALHFPGDPPGQQWSALAAGDFDGNGDADIVWRSSPAGLWRLTLLEDGVFERYEVYGSLQDQASKPLDVGDLDGDGRSDIAWSGVPSWGIGPDGVVHRFRPTWRGIHFAPETYLDPPFNTSEPGNDWRNWYMRKPGVIRPQVQEEMRAIRNVGGFSHLRLIFSAGGHITWPVPEDAELQLVADVVQDAYGAGFTAVSLALPTWCQLSEHQVANSSIEWDHVGGHCEGEILSCNTCCPPDPANPCSPCFCVRLFWDCVPCSPDWSMDCESGVTNPPAPRPGYTYLDRVKDYYSLTLTGIQSHLEARGVPLEFVEFVSIAGAPFSPFGGETNLFGNPEFELKQEVARFFKTIIPHVRSLTDWGVGVALLPENIGDPDRITYRFMSEWLQAMPIDSIDLIDVSIPSYFDSEEMLALIEPQHRHKVILSDFLEREQQQRTVPEVVEEALGRISAARVRGWWFWTYKTYTDSETRPVREYGVRGGNMENDVGWDHESLALFAIDHGYRE